MTTTRHITPLVLLPISRPDVEEIELDPDTRSIIVGRLELSDARIDDPAISRRHAEFREIGGRWHVLDLGSRHGTFVNGARIGPSPIRVENGDELDIGPIAFRIVTKGSALATDVPSTLIRSDASQPSIATLMTEIDRPDTPRVQSGAWLRELIRAVRETSEEAELFETAARALVDVAGGGRCLFLRPVDEFESIELLGNWPAENPARSSLGAPSRTLLEEAAKGSLAHLQGNLGVSGAQSIISAGVVDAYCAPVIVDGRHAAYVYFDSTKAVRISRDDLAGAVESIAVLVEFILSKIAKRSIEARMSGMERELREARDVQLRLMPDPTGEVGVFSYNLRSEAGHFVAGDIFGIHERPDGKIVAYLGDVTGHGVAPSLLMSATKSHMDALLDTDRSLADIIGTVNSYLAGVTADREFVTMFALEYDAQTRRLVCVDAGHGYALFDSADTGLQQFPIEGGLPLGIMRAQQYGSTAVPTDDLDRVILLSDGIVEQLDDARQEFGMQTVLDCLQAGDADDDLGVLITKLAAHAGGDSFNDDVTIASIGFQPEKNRR